MRRHSRALGALVFVVFLNSLAHAQQPQSLGAVRPSNLVLPQFAVSAFAGTPEVGQVVERDLTLGDYCAVAANSSAVSAARDADARAGAVDLDGWVAAGVHYVVRGSLGGGNAQAELFDIASKRRLFGKSYSGFGASDQRRLAHRIADDIITAMTNQPGIFSSRICYLVERGSGREVAVCDPDGGGARMLTNESAIVAAPCWGRNGTEVYYTSYRDNNPDLYGAMLNGSRFQVSMRPGLNTSAAWNEATGRIALTLSKDGNSEIYTMSRDGDQLARLTNTPDADTAPAWSPDGSRIAFTSDRSGSPGVYIMGTGGSGAQTVAVGGYYDSPAWSPDGRRLAFVAREKGEFNIYLADLAAGAPAVRLTSGQRDNEDPSWAPDSKHIVFSSNRGGSKQLYIMSVDMRSAHQLTNGPKVASPCWGPPIP